VHPTSLVQKRGQRGGQENRPPPSHPEVVFWEKCLKWTLARSGRRLAGGRDSMPVILHNQTGGFGNYPGRGEVKKRTLLISGVFGQEVEG